MDVGPVPDIKARISQALLDVIKMVLNNGQHVGLWKATFCISSLIAVVIAKVFMCLYRNVCSNYRLSVMVKLALTAWLRNEHSVCPQFSKHTCLAKCILHIGYTINMQHQFLMQVMITG